MSARQEGALLALAWTREAQAAIGGGQGLLRRFRQTPPLLQQHGIHRPERSRIAQRWWVRDLPAHQTTHGQHEYPQHGQAEALPPGPVAELGQRRGLAGELGLKLGIAGMWRRKTLARNVENWAPWAGSKW